MKIISRTTTIITHQTHYIWFHHTGQEQFFDLREDPNECYDLASASQAQSRLQLWRQRLAQINEQRGDPRGHQGKLVPQPQGALTLSPNYTRWKMQAEQVSGAIDI